MKNKKKYTDNT